MDWQRGSRTDYDSWNTVFGNGPGWTFNSLLPYFERAEQWTPPTNPILNMTKAQIASLAAVHGKQGPLSVSYNTDYTDLERPMLEALATLGQTPNPNPDGGDNVFLARAGCARSVDLTTGTRSYAASAYYNNEVRTRSNLVVLTGALVTKLNWANSTSHEIRASGVQYVVGNETFQANATKEVILSLGTSPSIERFTTLMRQHRIAQDAAITGVVGCREPDYLGELGNSCHSRSSDNRRKFDGPSKYTLRFHRQKGRCDTGYGHAYHRSTARF